VVGTPEDNSFSIEHLLTFQHDHPVVAADYIDGPFIGDSAKFVTCSTDAVRLWSAHGDLLFRLETGSGSAIKAMTVTTDDQFILAADGENISVWKIHTDHNHCRRVSQPDGTPHDIGAKPSVYESYACPDVEDIEVLMWMSPKV